MNVGTGMGEMNVEGVFSLNDVYDLLRKHKIRDKKIELIIADLVHVCKRNDERIERAVNEWKKTNPYNILDKDKYEDDQPGVCLGD